jgi:hypothetical protein
MVTAHFNGNICGAWPKASGQLPIWRDIKASDYIWIPKRFQNTGRAAAIPVLSVPPKAKENSSGPYYRYRVSFGRGWLLFVTR